jgi:DNA invertase Pin-like site-specific DNA recombinase
MKRRPATRTNTTDLTDLRVGLYCRVSLDKDDDAKSTTDQRDIGREWAAREGAVVVDEYVEIGSRSASRFAKKAREQFDRLLGDVEAGKLDAIWFWEQSRSSRRLAVFADLRDICRKMGVLWVERDRVVDPNDNNDMLSAGFKALISEQESEMTSLRVERGKRSSAHAGKRAGRVAYGYRTHFNPDGSKYDEPDLFDADRVAVADSPADVVKEIFARILAGHSITTIRNDLNDRDIRTAAGYPWANSKIRGIATNPTYIGKRVYQVGDGIRQTDRVKAILDGVEATWPPLVDEETFWAVHRILDDPARKTTRSGPRTGIYLLSSIARCGECGSKLAVKKTPANHSRTAHRNSYACRDRACVGIGLELLDEYVEEVMIRWLSDPDVAADLTRGEDSPAAALARADLERLRVELKDLYRNAKAGRVSAMIATTSETGLLERIREAEQQIQAATLPTVLRGNIGPQAARGWKALNLEVKRAIIRETADIRVEAVGRHGNLTVPARERVDWKWLIGPDVMPGKCHIASPAISDRGSSSRHHARPRPTEAATPRTPTKPQQAVAVRPCSIGPVP